MPTATPAPCDELRTADAPVDTPSPTPPPAAAPLHETGTLVATVLGSSLAFVVGSIINVALPSMQRDLGTDVAGAQWIVNAYLLPLGAFVLIGGALGDHYGRKRLFLIGLAVFTAGCLGCAVSPNLPLLLAARAVQGVGAALATARYGYIVASLELQRRAGTLEAGDVRAVDGWLAPRSR